MMKRIPIKPFKSERFPIDVRCSRIVGSRQSQSTRPRVLALKRLVSIAAAVPLLVSCASTPVALAPVGPSPFARHSSIRGLGDLQVYTEPEERYDHDLAYFPHTDYQLYTAEGRHLKRVWNHNTFEDETPARVSLPPGQYIVEASAEFIGLVRVPVVVKANELTKVVLQPGWNPGANVSRSDLVQTPKGY